MGSLLDMYPLSESYQDSSLSNTEWGSTSGGELENPRVATSEGRVSAPRAVLGSTSVLGQFELNPLGTMGSGQTAYNTGIGWFFDVHPTDGPRFSIGDSSPSGSRLLWDGTNLSLTGTVFADAGEIGGWSIGASQLTGGNVALQSAGVIQVGTGNNSAWLSAVDSTYRIWAGNAAPGSAPFRVSQAGAITAQSGTIGGWTLSASQIAGTNTILNPDGNITLGTSNNVVRLSASHSTYRLWAGHSTAGSAPFRVTQGGALTATGATISGSITATSGTIGGWAIGATSLVGGAATLASSGNLALGTSNNVVRLSADDATYRLWVGHATAGSAPFRVTSGGAMTATSGSIGGWNINGTGGIQLGTGSNTRGMSTGSIAFFAGSSTPSAAPFRVSTAGALTATNINVTGGSITADTINTGTLNGNLLGTGSVLNSAIDSLQANKITAGTLSANVTNTGTLTIGSGGFISWHGGQSWIDDDEVRLGMGSTSTTMIRMINSSFATRFGFISGSATSTDTGIVMGAHGGDARQALFRAAARASGTGTNAQMIAINQFGTSSAIQIIDTGVMEVWSQATKVIEYDTDNRFKTRGNIFPGTGSGFQISRYWGDTGTRMRWQPGSANLHSSAGSIAQYVELEVNGVNRRIALYAVS